MPSPSGGREASKGSGWWRRPATRPQSSTAAPAWTARRTLPRETWLASGIRPRPPSGASSGPASASRPERASFQESASQPAASTPYRPARPSEMFASGKNALVSAKASPARGAAKPSAAAAAERPSGHPPGRTAASPPPSPSRRRTAAAGSARSGSVRASCALGRTRRSPERVFGCAACASASAAPPRAPSPPAAGPGSARAPRRSPCRAPKGDRDAAPRAAGRRPGSGARSPGGRPPGTGAARRAPPRASRRPTRCPPLPYAGFPSNRSGEM